MGDSLGIYISVPFCKAKCTYCNFASDVFGTERIDAYVEQVCTEMRGARGLVAGFETPRDLGTAELPKCVDSVYLGGGTPSLLGAEQVKQIFTALRDQFAVNTDAEITLECAPGQLSNETLEAMLQASMKRVSFGVQSFIDTEAAAVGRLHTREMCLEEIARLRAAGVENINVDLIAGLPRQTRESWRESVEEAIASGTPHVSIYMLEVDEDSRLGREVLGLNQRTGNARYGADDLPSDDEIAAWYAEACGWLEAAGIRQYEISNFARSGHESRHNIRYWQRGPYLGFGLDAHSMLRRGVGGVRWANTNEFDEYLSHTRNAGSGPRSAALRVLPADEAEWLQRPEWIAREQAFEEAMFLGLRMNEGVDLDMLRAEFGPELVDCAMCAVSEIEEARLIEREGSRLRLTVDGRIASNEVFSRLLVTEPA